MRLIKLTYFFQLEFQMIDFHFKIMFFYVVHFYLYAIMQSILVRSGVLERPLSDFGFGKGGLHYFPFIACWMLGLFILYPLCSLYSRFKQTRTADSVFIFFWIKVLSSLLYPNRINFILLFINLSFNFYLHNSSNEYFLKMKQAIIEQQQACCCIPFVNFIHINGSRFS